MIKMLGEEKPLNHDYDEIFDYTKDAYDYMSSSLKHFFRLLDLDPELFKHLFDIDITIDYEELISYDELYSFYLSEENEIYISPQFISDYIDYYAYDNKAAVTHIVGQVLLHELLHANREIFLNNVAESYNLITIMPEEIKQYEKYAVKYGNVLLNDNENSIISIEEHKDYTILYLYIPETKSFFKYKMDTNLKDVKDIRKTINLIVNSQSYRKMYNLQLLGLYSSYEEVPVSNITKYDYNSKKQIISYNDEDIEESYNQFKIQNNTEEMLIDALAYIILYTSDKPYIDLDETYEYFHNKGIYPEHDISIFIFKELGIDFIKDYLLSCYQEEYKDNLKERLNDKFELVTTKLSKIYLDLKKGEEVDLEDIKSIKENILLLKK